MNLARIWRHIRMSPLTVKRSFTPETLQVIQEATRNSEATHRGEIRFVVEGELPWGPLLADVSPRRRALDAFAQLRVWDTEENNGVLIYISLADRDVEIIADRGIDRQVGKAGWTHICNAMREHFRAGRFREGSLAGIEDISAHLRAHFPPSGEDQNELSDQPLVR
jgi:uncharacterized membrane protein